MDAEILVFAIPSLLGRLDLEENKLFNLNQKGRRSYLKIKLTCYYVSIYPLV